MSKIEVNAIEPQCGTNLTVGASGDTITFPSGTTVVNNGTQTGFGRTGTVDWDTTPKTATFTGVSGNGYFVNTSGGVITVNLPASPSAGDIVAVADYAGTSDTNAITIGRNGSNINGAAADLTIEIENSAVTLVYVDGTQGWKATDTASLSDVEVQPAYVAATGGTITCSGNFKIHTFTGPGTFQVTCAGNASGSNTVDYLVVAGGASGGKGNAAGGGGGGAGGLRVSPGTASGCWTASPLGASPAVALPVSAQPYSITVGGGGAGQTAQGNAGLNGNTSTFSTITSAGGGAGGAHCNAAVAGGSGGGGVPLDAPRRPAGAGNTPPVNPAQGNPGGTGTPSAGGGYPSGGGGGAIANGQNGLSPNCNTGGAGGAGAQINICGNNHYWSGGGAGSAWAGQTGGAGGIGGGGGAAGPGGGGAGGASAKSSGAAGTPSSGGAGGTNTGSGGGGGNAAIACQTSGAGGSGIVIIRYKFQN